MHSPPHPGTMLRVLMQGVEEETGHRLTVTETAKSLGVGRPTLSAILNKKAGISPNMALRLAEAFQNTTAEQWLAMQEHYDLAEERKKGIPKVTLLWAKKTNPSPVVFG